MCHHSGKYRNRHRFRSKRDHNANCQRFMLAAHTLKRYAIGRQRMMMKVLLKMLAPYAAVLIFWCGLHSAWAALLAYHFQILFWSRRDLRRGLSGWNLKMFLAVALPCIAAGPLTYLLLPYMTRVPVQTWLAAYGLTGVALLLMVPYYGLIHPFLEQAHWSSLRAQPRVGPLAHVLFAAYHVLVLVSLLRTPWILLCVAVLLTASIGWRWLEQRTRGGLLVPVLSQVLADSGLVVAALIRAAG